MVTIQSVAERRPLPQANEFTEGQTRYEAIVEGEQFRIQTLTQHEEIAESDVFPIQAPTGRNAIAQGIALGIQVENSPQP